MGYIVDLSEHNTVTNWSAAAKDIECAILRMGYRGSISGLAAYKKITEDAKFRHNLENCIAHKIPYAVYFFPTSITDEEAVEEAVWIRDRVKGLDLKMPVFIDTENVLSNRHGRADRLSKATRTHLLRVLTDRLLSYGIPCGIYSYTSWFANNLDVTQMDARVIRNTWVAQNPSLTYKGTVALWQYGTRKFSWSSGPIDVNKKVGTFDMTVEKKEEQKVARYRNVIINKAKAYIGAMQGSAQHHEIIDAYNRYGKTYGRPRGYTVTYTDAWCATFVSAIAAMCGYADIIPVECSCPQMVKLAQQKGIWKESDAYVPSPGDIILYDWEDSGAGDNTGNPDHIGYVEACSGGKITVIEGNMGNASHVGRRTLAVNGKYIRGFITPKYTAAEQEKKAEAKTNAFTITLPDIHLGDRGEHVRLWQFLADIEPQDGFYGNQSANDTKDWQKANGKTVDGWVGKGCWTKAFKMKGWM